MLQDDDIIKLFFERSERAIEALAEKYGGVMQAVAVQTGSTGTAYFVEKYRFFGKS